MRNHTIVAALAVGLLGLGIAGAQQADAATAGLTVIGHRGGQSAPGATENGKYAVKAGLQTGANGVEVDVRETEDGKLVIMHDPTVDRTTNCTGEVAKLTYDVIRKCTLDSGEKVPNVYDIASTFSKYDSKTDALWLHVKFKPTAEMRAEPFKAVDKYELRAKVVILADEDEMLDSFAKWSQIHRALIFDQADVDQGGSESWTAGYDYAVPYQTPVTPALVAKARKSGSKVYGVESNPVAVTEAKLLGLDGILANDVAAALG